MDLTETFKFADEKFTYDDVRGPFPLSHPNYAWSACAQRVLYIRLYRSE